MATPRHWHILLYDVCDDTRRTKVHRILSSWGEPLQYSVFHVRCTARELAQLRCEIAHVITPEDRLAIIRLCPTCASHVTTQGTPLATPFSTDLPSTHII